MSDRKPTDIQMIKRILAELKKYGSPEELVRQLNLNTSIENRNHELREENNSPTRTRDGIQARIQEFLKQESEANKRRDDLLEENKSLEGQVNSKKKELAELLSSLAEKLDTTKEWEAIQQAMQNEHEKLRKVIVSCKTIIAPAYWVRSILEKKRPILFEHEKDYVMRFLQQKQPDRGYTDETGGKIIDFLIDELKLFGALVPKLKYDILLAEARREMYKARRVGTAFSVFFNAPETMTPEQRGTLLLGVIENAANSKEKFDELVKRATELGAHCPIHSVKLSYTPTSLKWVCPTLNCPFAI
jgi:hypothetical protein